MVSRVIPVDTFDLVLFGATGDLARRKILPGLFHRFVVTDDVPVACTTIQRAAGSLGNVAEMAK